MRLDQADPGLARRVPVRSASSNYLCPRVVDFGSFLCSIAFSLWLWPCFWVLGGLTSVLPFNFSILMMERSDVGSSLNRESETDLNMEIECVLLHLLRVFLWLPSISNKSLFRFSFWPTSDEVMPWSQEETDQEQPMLINTPKSWQITTNV